MQHEQEDFGGISEDAHRRHLLAADIQARALRLAQYVRLNPLPDEAKPKAIFKVTDDGRVVNGEGITLPYVSIQHPDYEPIPRDGVEEAEPPVEVLNMPVEEEAKAKPDLEPDADLRYIITAAAKPFGASYDDVMGDSRMRHIVLGRAHAIAAVKKAMPFMSSSGLGQIFGLHHSTVLHALEKAA